MKGGGFVEKVWQLLHDASSKLSQATTPEHAFRIIVQCARRIGRARIAGFALCHSDSLLGVVKAVDAEAGILYVATKLMRRALIGSPIAIPHPIRQGHKLSKITWKDSINPSSGPSNLGNRFNFDAVYGYPLRHDGSLFAVAGVVLGRGQDLSPEQVMALETLMRLSEAYLYPLVRIPSQAVSFGSVSPGANTILVEQGMIIDCSEAAASILGMPRETLLGKTIHDWLPAARKLELTPLVNSKFSEAKKIRFPSRCP